MIPYIGYIIDGIIILLLGAAIGYAVHISRSFREFKQSRNEFDSVLQELIQAIVHAEASIRMLKATAQNQGEELQEKIEESRALFDELQIINEGGNGLAERLEFLAEQASAAVQGLEVASSGAQPSKAKPSQPKQSMPHRKVDVRESVPAPRSVDVEDIFSIRDPDYERGDDGTAVPFDFSEDDWPEPDSLKSKAERDLYETLRKKSQTRSSRRT